MHRRANSQCSLGRCALLWVIHETNTKSLKHELQSLADIWSAWTESFKQLTTYSAVNVMRISWREYKPSKSDFEQQTKSSNDLWVSSLNFEITSDYLKDDIGLKVDEMVTSMEHFMISTTYVEVIILQVTLPAKVGWMAWINLGGFACLGFRTSIRVCMPWCSTWMSFVEEREDPLHWSFVWLDTNNLSLIRLSHIDADTAYGRHA